MHKVFTHPQETWDTRFSSENYIFGKEPNVWLARHAAMLKPGGRALAVADGEGRNSVWLATQGLQVDAFDISPVGIEKAKKLAAQEQAEVNFSVSGVQDWSWKPAHYDVIAAIFVQFADPEMRAALFANMIASLKPGGLLLLQGYTPKQLEYKTGGPPLLSHLYTEPMLREAFASLNIMELDSYDEVLNEGTQHSGMSALIGMVATLAG